MEHHILISASLQLGTEPPFKCVPLPVRMANGEGEVRLNGKWLPCPYNGEKPKPAVMRGVPVAGIATTWEMERSYNGLLDLKVAQAIDAAKRAFAQEPRP